MRFHIDVGGNNRHILLFYKKCHFCQLLPFAKVGQYSILGLGTMGNVYYTKTISSSMVIFFLEGGGNWGKSKIFGKCTPCPPSLPLLLPQFPPPLPPFPLPLPSNAGGTATGVLQGLFSPVLNTQTETNRADQMGS